MRINQLLAIKDRRPVDTLDATDLVSAAVERFSDARFRGIPVVKGGKLAGILTIRDVVRHLAAKGSGGLATPIGDAMTRDPVTVSTTDDVEVAEKAFGGRFNHLPVVDGGELVGLLTPADLLQVRLGELGALATDLEHYIMGR